MKHNDRYKMVAVSYLNTKPLLYALRESSLSDRIDLRLEIPSKCAALLENGDADMGLVPVAAIPNLPGATIFSDYCIGCDGQVATVCLVGEQPIEEWKSVFLDFHSRTSVQLTKVLFREYWQLEVDFSPAYPGYFKEIKGQTGGLIIGDRACNLEQRYRYVYDLGAIWKAHTGLPFVFAAWVSLTNLTSSFKESFNAVMRKGIEGIPHLLSELNEHKDLDLERYFRDHISYNLNSEKKEALQLFLSKIDAPEVVFV